MGEETPSSLRSANRVWKQWCGIGDARRRTWPDQHGLSFTNGGMGRGRVLEVSLRLAFWGSDERWSPNRLFPSALSPLRSSAGFNRSSGVCPLCSSQFTNREARVSRACWPIGCIKSILALSPLAVTISTCCGLKNQRLHRSMHPAPSNAKPREQRAKPRTAHNAV
jgi:hypothetical protein